MQIIAARPLEAGQEIFNTYGELGNAELVSKYGFALADNPFNKVTLDKEKLLEAAAGFLSKKSMVQRCHFLEQERCGALTCESACSEGASVSADATSKFVSAWALSVQVAWCLLQVWHATTA